MTGPNELPSIVILVPPRANAATELNMIAWYGHGEPDMVEEFEAMHNVKIKAKYYAGGDNMLALNLLFLLNTLVGLELQKFKSLMQKKDLIIDLLRTLLKMEFIMTKHVVWLCT